MNEFVLVTVAIAIALLAAALGNLADQRGVDDIKGEHF
jgi:hypothetical protein